MISVWPFKKKRHVPSVSEPPPCKHKWQDFPWIIRFYFDYGKGTLKVEIWEPYVSIYCKKRENRKLIEDYYDGISGEEIDELMKKYREKYRDYCQHEAVVEDQINDFQLVDREWLEIANMLRRSRN